MRRRQPSADGATKGKLAALLVANLQPRNDLVDLSGLRGQVVRVPSLQDRVTISRETDGSKRLAYWLRTALLRIFGSEVGSKTSIARASSAIMQEIEQSFGRCLNQFLGTPSSIMLVRIDSLCALSAKLRGRTRYATEGKLFRFAGGFEHYGNCGGLGCHLYRER